MLSLTVHSGEYITIGPDIVVQVLKTGEVTRLAIDAPRELDIVRSKLVEAGGEAPACIQRLRRSQEPPRVHDFKRSPLQKGSV